MHPQPLNPKGHERDAHDRATHGGHQAAGPSAGAVCNLTAVRALATRAPALTTSIFLPTHRAGGDKHQDHTRLKNLMHQARQLLCASADAADVDRQLAPLARLVDDPVFWAHPQDGLALFISGQEVSHFWLPAAIREQVVVCEHCHIKPLLPLLQVDGRFYLLELTQHGVTLHAGSRLGMSEIALSGAPLSVEADRGGSGREHHSEVRTVQGGAQHGSRHFGAVGDVRAKEDVSHYFRAIDASVCALLHAEHAPLVIAGVDYLLPLYREVNSYPHLVVHGIPANPASLSRASLHEQAWNAVAPHFQAAIAGARERYDQLHGSPRAAHDLPTVLRALVQGRIRDLFVASDTERWGTYDVIDDKVREHQPRWPADDDLLNLALLQGIATHSFTVAVPRSEVPGGGELAATFRY